MNFLILSISLVLKIKLILESMTANNVKLNDIDVEILSKYAIFENEKTLFGSSIEKNTSFQAINFGPLKEYENNWNVFKNGLTNGERDPAVVS